MTSPARHTSARRRRLVAASAALASILAGLAVHRFGTGDVGDITGDALYAALVYLLLVTVFPRTSRRALAATAIIFCTGIEMLQLTDIPATITAAFPPAFLVFGAAFDQRDIIVYAFAVVGVLIVDVTVSRLARPRRQTKTP